MALLGTTSAEDGLEGDDAPKDISTRLQCVVAGGAPCEFRVLPAQHTGLKYWLGGTRAEKPEAYALASPLKFVSKDDPPMYFYHGEKDSLVPLLSPQAMVAAFSLLGVKTVLHTVPGGGHISAFLDPAAVDNGIKFLDENLKTLPAVEVVAPGGGAPAGAASQPAAPANKPAEARPADVAPSVLQGAK